MNNFILQLVAGLSKTKSKQQIKSDAKSLGDMYVKLIGNLDMPKTRKAIKAQLKGLNNLTFNITPNVNTKGVQSATKQAINNAQRVADSNKVRLNFDTSKQQLVNQIKILGRNNNKLFSDREMTAKYNQLLNSANVAKSTGELKTLRGELSAFKTELVATNNAGMTWGAKFKKSIESYAKFFSGASFVYTIFNLGRNAATEAKTLDDSLVDLQKVTDEISDRDALYKYFDKSLSKAQELNVKVGSLIDAVTEFKKLGWDLDDAELGAKWANILSNVGDVDIDTAIGSIKTSIASFNEIGGYTDDQMDKKLEAYTDLINNMSNKYSIDAEGLAESIRLSAGTLTEAHMSIEQAATMFATANKYYNDPSYLGNTAKIGSLRMRASSGDTDAIEELQEMGEEVDDLATATSNLREKLMALTGVDIMEDEHTFKSYYEQLYEISQVMDKLDDTSRANVLETMFGKSRSAAGAAILSGMKESASAYEDAINSAGSATEEYQTWMTIADAACQRFSNTLTETYQSIINGNTVRDLANLGSAVLEFANNWGIVEGTLKGVIALNLGKFIATGGMALITATKQVEQYGKALQMASNVPNGNLSARFQALKSIAQATSSLTTEQLRNVLATNTLTQADRVRILQMQGMTKEMGLQKLAEMNLTQATNTQTAANTASTASTFSLKAAMIGLGRTIQSVFLSNPVGIVLMGVSLGVSALTSYISKQNQALEETRQKAKEAADNANTLGDEIAELANKYIQLSDAVKTDASAIDDLMTTQTELLKKLGLEGESIDDLIAKYGSLSNAIKQASIDSLKNQQTDLIAGVNAAKEELMDVAKDNFWGTDNIISASGEEAVKAFKELEKAGVIDSGSYGTGGGQLVLIGDDTVEGALENYKKLEDAVNALRDSEAFTADELSDNSLFNSIYSRYSEMKESVEAYNSSIDNLNENLAQQTMLTALQGNELPKTEEGFNKFKQALIDTAVASKQFIGNEKEITDAIDNYLATVPEFEGYYSVPLENEFNKVDELVEQTDFSIPSVDDLQQQISDLNSAIDSIQSAYDTLNSAVEEYNSNGGQLSIDTIQSLLSLSDEYLACLQVENGQLSLNADAMAQLAQSKLDEAQATAVTQALTELQAIANGEAAQSTTTYISGNAALMDSLAKLSGSYEGVAQAAMTAAQAQELSAQIESASNKDKTATENVLKGLDTKLKLIQSTKNAISAGNFASVAKKSSSGSSSKSTKDELKEQFQAEYDLLKHNLEMGYITEEQYYNGVQALNEKYFAGKSEYLDEYRKYEEEVYKGLKSYYKSYCDSMVDYYEKALDANKISFGKYVTDVTALVKSMWDTGKISAEDYWNYVHDMLTKQINIYDSVISAATQLLADEIDKLNDEIDALEEKNDALNKEKDNYDSILSVVDEVYQKEIDKLNEQKEILQDKIDAINDANDALDLQYRKSEAIYALQKAQEQRNRKVYNGKEFVYTTDKDAIRDAQKTLQDIETEEIIDSLEKEQEALENSISELEKYRDKWAEITDAYEKEINQQLAIARWGKDYEAIILSNRIEDINDFKNQYISIQKQVDDNQSTIDSINEKIDYYNKLKDKWGEVAKTYEEQQNRIHAAEVLGQDWEQQVLSGRLDTIQNFTNSYVDLCQKQAEAAQNAAKAIVEANQQAQNSTSNTDTSITSTDNSGGSSGGGNGGGSTTPPTNNNPKPYWTYRIKSSTGYATEAEAKSNIGRFGGNGVAKSGSKWYVVQWLTGYATNTEASKATLQNKEANKAHREEYGYYKRYFKGTDNADPGLATVSEDGDELVVKDDKAELIHGEQFYNFKGGERVIPADETKEILKNQGNVEPLDSEIITHNGIVLKPVHPEYENLLTNFMKANPDYMYSLPNPATDSYKNMLKGIENVNYDNRNVNIEQNVNITLPNITNDNGYNNLTKELNRLKLDAYQFVNKR